MSWNQIEAVIKIENDEIARENDEYARLRTRR